MEKTVKTARQWVKEIGMLPIRDVQEEVAAEDKRLLRDLEHEHIEFGGNTGGSY